MTAKLAFIRISLEIDVPSLIRLKLPLFANGPLLSHLFWYPDILAPNVGALEIALLNFQSWINGCTTHINIVFFTVHNNLFRW